MTSIVVVSKDLPDTAAFIPMTEVQELSAAFLVIHRDHNGSLNILAHACQAVGRHSRVIPEAHGL